MSEVQSRWVGVWAIVAAGLTGMGCGDGGGSEELGSAERVGSVELAIVAAPVDALCLRFTVTVGTQVVTRTVDVARGRSAFSIDGLPLGSASIRGEAFSVACTSVTATTNAAWVAAAVSASLTAGTTPVVTLAFQRGGSVAINADFAPGAAAVKQVAVGGFHTCALLRDGTVRCWGRNDVGQLGDRTTTSRNVPTAAGRFGIVELAAGNRHTCGLLTDRTVVCWGGQQNVGVLGNGQPTGSSSSPVPVTGLTGVTHIAAGQAHTCALLSGGSVRCWGSGFQSELGQGSNSSSSVPAEAVVGLPRAVQVVASGIGSGALAADGTAWGWGNGGGDFVFASPSNGLYAVRTAIHSGQRCSVFLDGTAACVGVTSPGLTGVVDVAMGQSFQFVLLSDGTVRGWGSNSFGQLGNGNTIAQATPVAVQGLTNVAQIAASTTTQVGGSACAVLGQGQLRCWGSNSDGQLGNGTTGGQSPTPVSPLL